MFKTVRVAGFESRGRSEVGWVERSDTHQLLGFGEEVAMGIGARRLYPSYECRLRHLTRST
jgi:hypothetical protein